MSVASKNLFELLGNDDGDSDNVAPVKTVDKNTTRTVKRNTDGEGPANKGTGAPARRAGPTGNDGAFRDRGAGSDRNRVKSTDDGAPRGGFRGGRNARVRGGPGARFPRDRDDRHNKSGPGGGSDKQAAQGWGAPEGEAEMKDEQAGEEIAKKDEKDAAAEDAEGGAREEYPAEPEDKSVSYADYLAEQTEKKLALEHENTLKVRKPNEGSKQNKQWAAAKPLVKEEDDEFISGSGGKVKRERERKTKQLVEIDNRYIEPDRPRGGGGGGRGGSRGGRGESSRGGPRGDGRVGGGGGRGGGPRGEYRGGRGGGGDRGDRSDRGDRGGRGDYRGGRGGGRGGGQGLNTNDETAFPTLGS